MPIGFWSFGVRERHWFLPAAPLGRTLGRGGRPSGEVILCSISSAGRAHCVFQDKFSSGTSALVRGQVADRKRNGR